MLYDVCAAVIGDLSVDARVWKEVSSLVGDGRTVKLIGCAYNANRVRRETRHGADVVEVPLGPMSVTPTLSRKVRLLLTVWGEIERTEARVYHSHNVHVFAACWASARRHHGKLVYDAHELWGEKRQGDGLGRRIAVRASRELEGFAVSRADAVITTNPSRLLALQARHGLREIHVLANVPDLVEVIEPCDPGYPQGAEILLYQGGIYAEERPFRECLQALRLLPDVHFVIVGFGRDSQIELVRKWAVAAGVAARVHVLPAVPFERLVHTAALATVGLVPLTSVDLNYHLGDTNKLHEYLMAGLPVIASDIPEVRRVATQGDPPVGELFEAKDPASIAAAYKRVVSDPETYRRRREEARRLAKERHHWGIESEHLLALYERLLGGGSSSAQSATDRASGAVSY